MKNVKFSQDGDTLVIRVNLKERHGKSGSGKSTIVASTGGNQQLLTQSGEAVKIGLNVFVTE